MKEALIGVGIGIVVGVAGYEYFHYKVAAYLTTVKNEIYAAVGQDMAYLQRQVANLDQRYKNEKTALSSAAKSVETAASDVKKAV